MDTPPNAPNAPNRMASAQMEHALGHLRCDVNIGDTKGRLGSDARNYM
jgi:hypothetical protein